VRVYRKAHKNLFTHLSFVQGCTGQHWRKPYFTSEHFSAMAGQLNTWSAQCTVSRHFQLTPRNGIGLFLVVACLVLGFSARVTYFIVSVADTLHIYLLCHTFWDSFVTGKAAGLIVLSKLKWSVFLSSDLLNTKSEVVRRQLIVKPTLFLP
jgi:hypothetical protein